MTRNENNDRKTSKPSPFAAPIVALTRLSVRFPVPTLVVSLALALAALLLAACELEMKTSRLDLINPKSEFNRRWLDYVAEFGDEDDLAIVVEGKSRAQIEPVLAEIADELERRPQLFKSIFAGVDRAPLARKGLYFLSDAQFQDAVEFARLAEPLAAGRTEALTAEAFAVGFARRLAASRTTSDVEETFVALAPYAKSLAVATAPETSTSEAIPSPTSPAPELDGASESTGIRRLTNDDGTLGVVNFELVEGKEGSFAYGTKAIDEARAILADVRSRRPGVDVGLTGLTTMENDEMRASQETSTVSSVLALIGVALVFIAAFGGLKRPLIAVFALAVGFAWTMGFVAFAVGHLNILSMSFGVVLIGLGIDFGIHYVSKYTSIRAENRSVGESILATAEAIGPSVCCGAATTAGAFATVGFSEFVGIAELGIVSAGGVLLCCLSALVVVPAALMLADGPRPFQAVQKPINVCAFVVPIFRFPKTVLVATLAPTFILACGVAKLHYDHNLLDMQPEKLESVEYERKLLEKWDKGAWFAVSVADSPEELLARKAEFEKDPTLRTDEIVSLFPRVSDEKQREIERTSDALSALGRSFGDVPVGDARRLGGALDALAQTLRTLKLAPSSETVETSAPSDSGLLAERDAIFADVSAAARQISALPTAEYALRIEAFQRLAARETTRRLLALQAISTPTPPELGDLPTELVDRFVGKTGKLALRVYSTNDVWAMERLKPFVEKIRAVDPNATGNPIQTYEASLQMERSYFVGGIWAFCVVFALVLFDFRSLKYTILALAPTFFGVLQGFGLLGWLGVALNPANSIVVPLILGIGIDDGVHLAHDFQKSRGEYRLAPSIASSIVLTTLTTAMGFGSLMIADHRGLQSLGRVLTIGVTTCMFSSLVVMPAVLTILRRRELAKEKRSDVDR